MARLGERILDERRVRLVGLGDLIDRLPEGLDGYRVVGASEGS